MKVAVVTPYFKETTEVLRRCHESVIKQTHREVFHVMVSDGLPRPEIDQWERVIHIRGPWHDDYGDTPRAIGSLSAANQGADAICFLDADNWFEPDHVQMMIDVSLRLGAQVITGTRFLCRPDGTRLGVCTESNGETFSDTNCLFLTKQTFPICSAWGYKNPRDGLIGDKIFWKTLQSAGYSRAHCTKPTVNYSTMFADHYRQFGEAPPPGAKMIFRFGGQLYSQPILFEDYERLLHTPGVSMPEDAYTPPEHPSAPQ